MSFSIDASVLPQKDLPDYLLEVVQFLVQGMHLARLPAVEVVQEILELFFSNGFVPTKDDLLRLLTRGHYIQNPERFGIKIEGDQDIFLACTKRNFYPYKKEKTTAKCTTKMLEEACMDGETLATIKMMVKNGAEPNHQNNHFEEHELGEVVYEKD